MIVLSGAELVLPDRVLSPGTLVIDDGPHCRNQVGQSARRGQRVELSPFTALHRAGFIDVHVHGVEGVRLARTTATRWRTSRGRLPRFGVTAFCPTTVACAPAALRRVLEQVRRAREMPIRSRRARAAGASRKQLHQPRIQGRAAARLPAESAQAARMQTRRSGRRRAGGQTEPASRDADERIRWRARSCARSSAARRTSASSPLRRRSTAASI